MNCPSINPDKPRRQKLHQIYPPAHTHPVVKHLMTLIRGQNVVARELGKRAGVDYSSIYYWARGKTVPRLWELSAVLEVLGYELQIIPKAAAQSNSESLVRPSDSDSATSARQETSK